MRAWVLDKVGAVETYPMELREHPVPEPGPGEIRVRVEVCGVCRTDLHVVEGDLEAQRAAVVPGHQVVGRVDALGPGTTAPPPGTRVGVAWLNRSCGTCRFCQSGRENLCLDPVFTGWQADGGYADFVVAAAEFVHEIDDGAEAEQLAPLLCAGVIGYRAFLRSGARPGSRLGLWGFGASAHIVIQIARHAGCEVHVFSREPEHADLARELGATWVGTSQQAPPHPLQAAILFAPAGELVPTALSRLDRGGTLAVAGIHLSAIPALDYNEHLFHERSVTSVTANTREDARALLRLAREIPIQTHVRSYPLSEAGAALIDLKAGRLRGAAVLRVGS